MEIMSLYCICMESNFNQFMNQVVLDFPRKSPSLMLGIAKNEYERRGSPAASTRQNGAGAKWRISFAVLSLQC